MGLNPIGIERFCRTLEASCGLSYQPDRAYLFDSRLVEVIARHALKDYDDLTHLFLADDQARQRITEALVTSETYFFRDEATFQQLPALADSYHPAPHRPLVIWSLGCATGQEAYSILMALDEHGLTEASLRLIGVDISEAALSRARAGRYTAFEVSRGLSAVRTARYMAPVEGGFEVRAPWRTVPQWVRANLVTGLPSLEAPQIVFCRNTLYYFNDAIRQRILTGIHGRMAPGGTLVLAGTENAYVYAEACPGFEVQPNGALVKKP